MQIRLIKNKTKKNIGLETLNTKKPENQEARGKSRPSSYRQKRATKNRRNTATNAAFPCYQKYHKYEFPSWKLDVNGLSSCIYYWQILK